MTNGEKQDRSGGKRRYPDPKNKQLKESADMLKRIIGLLMLFSLIVTGSIAETRPVTASPAPVECRLEVLDAVSNEPIPGAKIAIGGVSGTTDTDGLFTASLLWGTYTVNAEKEGYAGSVSEYRLPGETAVTVLLTPESLSFVLEVKDAETLEPVPGAEISVDGDEVTGTTDSTGRLEVNLSLGAHHVSARKEGYAVQSTDCSVPEENTRTLLMSVKRVPVTLQVRNATNVQAIAGADLVIEQTGLNGTADSSGEFTAELPAGSYVAVAKKEGFADKSEAFTVSADHDRETVQLIMSPLMPETRYRAVLTWGFTPYDLDSHLFGQYQNDKYSIRFDNKNPLYVGGQPAGGWLDVDDTNSYGPETTTFDVEAQGEYAFFVYNWSDKANASSDTLSKSGAKVSLYKGSESDPIFEWSVPEGTGVVWHVFDIRNGSVTSVDRIGNINQQLLHGPTDIPSLQ